MTRADDTPRFRGGVVRGVVTAVDDTGSAQTIAVQTHDGVERTGIEVASIHGIATNPGVGAEALLLAIEGDQTNYVALPLSLFGLRFGNVPGGGAGIYDHGGNRIMFPGDGTGLLTVAGLLRILVQSLDIETQAGTTIAGPVTFENDVVFQGNVTFQRDVTIGGALHVAGPATAASFNGHS